MNPALTEEEQEAAAELAEHHRHHHHGGVTRFIAISIETLGVDEKQKDALEKIEVDLDKKLAASRGKSHAVLAAVADEVAKGVANAPAVDKAIAELAKASAAVHEASADALVKLHDTLTPAQRRALMDKVHAHWAVWHEVNTDSEAAGEKHPHRGNLGRLAKKLDLSAEQVDKIREAEKATLDSAHAKIERKVVDAHLESFTTAFESDKFDPKAVKDGPNSHMATWGATRLARYYEAMIPLLKPEQRTKLAEMLRSHTAPPKAKK